MTQTQSKNNRIIGLDMHPDVFAAAAVIGERADSCMNEWVHDRQSTSELESWAKKHLRRDDIVVLEASGNSFEVAHVLGELGYTTLVLESQQAGKLQDNYCNDDKSSAVKLAKIYLTGMAKVVWQPDPKTRLNREVFFKHRNAVKDCTKHRNRIRSYLSDHCVRLPRGTSLTAPSGLQKALSLRTWDALEIELLSTMFEELWFCEKQRKKMKKIMAMEVANNDKMRPLLRILGVNLITAFGLVAIIGDINRFSNPKKLVGYFGVAPRKKQSGNNKEGIKGGIGNGGRGDIRALLVQGAQSALKYNNNPFFAFGWRVLKRHSRNVAIGAIARKMVVSIWYLLKRRYTPLLEVNVSLKEKLVKLASAIGLETVKNMGYSSSKEFIETMAEKLTFSEKILE